MGETVYIPNSLEDEFIGGIASISEIRSDKNEIYVRTREKSDTFYKWDHLCRNQRRLRRDLPNQRAHYIKLKQLQ